MDRSDLADVDLLLFQHQVCNGLGTVQVKQFQTIFTSTIDERFVRSLRSKREEESNHLSNLLPFPPGVTHPASTRDVTWSFLLSFFFRCSFLSFVSFDVKIVLHLSVEFRRWYRGRRVTVDAHVLLVLDEKRKWMDETRFVDHFALIGVGSTGPIERDELLPTNSSPINESPLPASSKNYDVTPQHQQPIVDLVIIDRTHGEDPPAGYEAVWTTPSLFSANINCSGLRNHEMFLCIRRGRDKAPITDIGILLEGREKVMENVSIIETTPHGYPASIFSSSFTKERSLVTYRRATSTILCNTLAVTDVCVIIESKVTSIVEFESGKTEQLVFFSSGWNSSAFLQ